MLPQRRKSAEEIAQLRESLGISGAPPEGAPGVPQAAAQAPAPAPVEPLPAADEPALPAEDEAEPTVQQKSWRPPPEPADEAPPPRITSRPPYATEDDSETPRKLKSVRSLRKSEQGTVASKPYDPNVAVVRVDAAAIPHRRHDDRELMEMRRVQAAAPDQSISYLLKLTAPWPLLVLAYLVPLIGMLFGWLAVWMPTIPSPNFWTISLADLSRQPWLGDLGFGLLFGFAGLGLLLAGWIAWKKPRSRHHASFITIIAVVILAYGLNHQFGPTYGP